MSRHLVRLATLAAVVLTASPLLAQTETYLWDGSTSNDWYTSTNWTNTVTLMDPTVPAIPDVGTRVEIQTTGASAPVIAAGSAQTHQVRIGRSGGAGELTVSGGTLTTNAAATVTVRVGNGLPGTLNLSSGTINLVGGTMTTGDGGNWKGQINVTGGAINITGAGRDLNMDEFAGSTAASNLAMSNGTISIADVLLVDNLASVDLSGGTITAGVAGTGGIRIRRDSDVHVTGGLLESLQALELGSSTVPGGTLRIDGGIVRARSFGTTGATALITLDGSGLLQVLNSQESVASMEGRITSGLIAGMSPLQVSVVNVGGMDYTQVAAVPEPLAALLLLPALAALPRRAR